MSEEFAGGLATAGAEFERNPAGCDQPCCDDVVPQSGGIRRPRGPLTVPESIEVCRANHSASIATRVTALVARDGTGLRAQSRSADAPHHLGRDRLHASSMRGPRNCGCSSRSARTNRALGSQGSP